MIILIITLIWLISSIGTMYLTQYLEEENLRDITLGRIIICLLSGPVGLIVSFMYSFEYIDLFRTKPFTKNKE